jgi:hypothetical protein
MGWGRECVHKGLKGAHSGIKCLDNYKGRGRKKTEDILPNIEQDIRSLVEQQTQADPAMKGSLTYYTRITAKAVRQALIDEKGYTQDRTSLKEYNRQHVESYGVQFETCIESQASKKN